MTQNFTVVVRRAGQAVVLYRWPIGNRNFKEMALERLFVKLHGQ